METRTSFGQSTLSREYFASAELFALERERIFQHSWLLAGHVSQLAATGSYFLLELDRESVIVVRDADAQVRAFHNHCRHRGSRLCQHAAGELGASIQCPYHAWTYALDGSLRTVPAMNEVAGFDTADYPLHRVALEVWEGFVFVNLARDPIAFGAALPGLVGRFTHRQAAELQSVHQQKYEVEGTGNGCSTISASDSLPDRASAAQQLTPFRNSGTIATKVRPRWSM